MSEILSKITEGEAISHTISELELWHSDTYGENRYDNDGFLLESFNCHNCVVCKAIEGLRTLILSEREA